MKILVTGAAGFIGSNVSHAFLNIGAEVVGIDNLNDYYDVGLKHARLSSLTALQGFTFHEADLNDLPQMKDELGEFDLIIHLAAQAGVRYSLENPFAYAQSNLLGHLSVLELARHHKKLPRVIYASSSSVYGNSSKPPYSEKEYVNKPVSLYAATKIADEAMSYSYATLYGLELVGLRFFTVYGPWGRPDMAYWGFSDAILSGRPIKIFNNGKLRRDFTYIDDIIDGIMRIATNEPSFDGITHKVYNIGNNKPVELMTFIETLEQALGQEAIKEYLPMQKGDVFETCADISAISKDYGFSPKTDIATGLGNFATWFKEWRKIGV